MHRFWVLFIILVFSIECPAYAIFQKKDYKQIFLNNALNAEKRYDDKSAFHSYEKAMYYYKKDKKVIEAYASFCERRNYLEKASSLYKKLYIMTKDPKYKFKAEICEIKNGSLSEDKVELLEKNKSLSALQKKELNKALIFHYEYKQNWKKVKSTCNKLPRKEMDLEVINACIFASEKTADKKAMLKYEIRHYELSPKDSGIIANIIQIAEKLDDYKVQEIYVKKLMALNQKDRGIKYKLAGIYEKQNKWLQASKVYEALLISGDKSEHVVSSYNYVKSQFEGKPKKKENEESTKVYSYKPKPLSPFKIAEKGFYAAWAQKDYENAQIYLEKMLKEEPDNKKLLRHRVDIDVSQENYQKAIDDFAKLNTKSKKDFMFLAFLYSQEGDNKKAISTIEEALKDNPEDTELLDFALQYSLADKNWDSAILYNDKLLAKEPKSEKLLKNAGDFNSIKKDFKNAALYYEKLVKLYPKDEYKQELANLYMASQQFPKAEMVLEPLYRKYPEDKKITDSYLNVLLAQNKTSDAYWVVDDKGLEDTWEGLMVLGDLAMNSKKYDTAQFYYDNSLKLNPKSLMLQNKLGDAYRLNGDKAMADSMYSRVLLQDPENYEARLGIGSLEYEYKNFPQARNIFNSILDDKPDYRPAQVAIAHSYIANDEKLNALKQLSGISDDDETKFMKAQVYYNMNMRSDSKDWLSDIYTDDAKKLKSKIKKDNAFTITPVYKAFYQTLADEFRLNYQKYGLEVSQDSGNNSNVFFDYNTYWYTSGASSYLSNVTNEIIGGVKGRPNNKFEYRADLGVKVFQHFGAMINTDSWLKYYINDFINLKIGYYRNNLEQSYTSAIGQFIDGVYTGQVADNRVYLEYESKLPNQYYSFGRFSYGFLPAQNLPTNNYFEGYIGAGKAFYNNPKNKWLNIFAFDLVTYNSAYQYNLLNLYSTSGQLYGGYFSPSYFNATTGNLKIEGYIKQLRLHYGVKAFAGIQNAISPNMTSLTWGVNPYAAFDINDHMCLTGMYSHFTFGDVQRDIFMFNLIIKVFKKYGEK